MSARFPPSKAPLPAAAKKVPATTPASADPNNALWRMKEWFPDLDPQIHQLLHVFHGELIKFNLRLNLISRATEREADEVHFADCLSAAQLISATGLNKPVYDIGSGNGLPGIILGILNPSLEIHLVESDSRKCEFLKHAIHVLKLPQVKVMNVRLESLKEANMSLGISRGFATIAKTVLACNKVFTKGGKFYHLKGPSWSREIADIPSQLISVWTPELVGEYSLPVSQGRRAVVCTTKIS